MAVSLVTVTAASIGGSAPITSLDLPDDLSDFSAEHVRNTMAVALKNDAYVRTDATDGLVNKVAKTGDTMTDLLEITVSSADTPALDVTGNGTAPGTNSTGGATGAGGNFEAGGGNMPGTTNTGNGTGAGASCIGGATGPGIAAASGTAQTATAPTCAAQLVGYLQLTGTDPNAGVDPGANNVLHAMNIPKAWVLFDSSYSVLASYNVTSITTILGDVKRIDFVRPMASANYGVKFAVHGAPGGDGAHNGTKDANGFEFVLFDTASKAPGFPASTTEAYVEVMGAQ